MDFYFLHCNYNINYYEFNLIFYSEMLQWWSAIHSKFAADTTPFDWIIWKMVYNDSTPPEMRHIIVKAENKHGLRNGNKAVVPRFNTNFMKHSIAYRDPLFGLSFHSAWMLKLVNLSRFFNIVRSKNILKNISFKSSSVQTVILNDDVFKFYWNFKLFL